MINNNKWVDKQHCYRLVQQNTLLPLKWCKWAFTDFKICLGYFPKSNRLATSLQIRACLLRYRNRGGNVWKDIYQISIIFERERRHMRTCNPGEGQRGRES